MTQQPIVSFQNVSKRFTYSRNQGRGLASALLSGLRKHNHQSMDELWALRDISFDVMPGDSVGLIGRNGSGKSTLLKLATRILRPTTGQVKVKGRISALLELGAGFHEELTGRENIFLNGSVLGLSRNEIEAIFDEIVDFSELHDFIDVPVKHYSSGMYMRLGFSVAVHCKPDVLLVDEILAVGDQAFQQKCIDRIFKMKSNGLTIIMVSHHLETLQKLCSRLVWVEQGDLKEHDETSQVVGKYVEYMNSRSNRSETSSRMGTWEAEIIGVRFLDANGDEAESFQTGDPMTVELAYDAHQPIREPEIGLSIFRDDGMQINGINNRLDNYPIDVIDGKGILSFHIKRLPLMPGEYVVSVAIQHANRPQAYDFHVKAYRFKVVAGGTAQYQGIISFPATWELQAVDN